jgi:hypothetical protein
MCVLLQCEIGLSLGDRYYPMLLKAYVQLLSSRHTSVVGAHTDRPITSCDPLANMLAIRIDRGMESTSHTLQLDAFETMATQGSSPEVIGQNVAALVLHPASPCDEVANTSSQICWLYVSTAEWSPHFTHCSWMHSRQQSLRTLCLRSQVKMWPLLCFTPPLRVMKWPAPAHWASVPPPPPGWPGNSNAELSVPEPVPS